MSDIETIRLRIKDPYGVLYFETVTSLPTEYDPQTAYIFEERYYIEGDKVRLKVSDQQLTDWLAEDDATVDSVTVKALESMRADLSQELFTVKTNSGSDSQEYTSLKDQYDFYTNEIEYYNKKICKNKTKSSPRFGGFRSPDFVCEV